MLLPSLVAPFALHGSWLTTKEVAELLRVHPKHVYRLLKRGLPARQVGGHWRFSPAEVRQWMARGQPSRARASSSKESQSATSTSAPTLIATNGDLAIEALIAEVNSERPTVGLAPSDTATALDWLAGDEVLAVGVLGDCVAPPGTNLARLHLAYQQFGLATPPDREVPALAHIAGRGHQLASWPGGSDVRSQLDGVLRREGIDSRRIHARATIAHSFAEVASALLRGQATVGVLTAAWAQRCGLAFVPLGSRPVGVICQAASLGHPALIRCWHVLQSVSFANALAGLGGLELTDPGRIQHLLGDLSAAEDAEPGKRARPFPETARWVLLQRARGVDSSGPLLDLASALRARDLRVAGFVQQSRRRGGAVVAYELHRLLRAGRVVLARRRRSPPAGTKLRQRSFQFDPGAFAEARRWLEADGRRASVLIIDGVGTVEGRGQGHHDALVWALRQRGPKVVVVALRRDQSAAISQRLGLASRQLAVIDAEATETEMAGLVDAIEAAARPTA